MGGMAGSFDIGSWVPYGDRLRIDSFKLAWEAKVLRARTAWWWLRLKAYVGSYATQVERDDRER